MAALNSKRISCCSSFFGRKIDENFVDETPSTGGAACIVGFRRFARANQHLHTHQPGSGGWHDAGDQLKYLITASNATARMLLSLELARDKFKDSGLRKLKIEELIYQPESAGDHDL